MLTGHFCEFAGSVCAFSGSDRYRSRNKESATPSPPLTHLALDIPFL